MASDGDSKESAKKRVSMSASAKGKKLESPKKIKAAADGAASDEGRASMAGATDAFTEGMAVSVRSTDGDKKMLAATVVRVHRSGELSVKYDSSGEVEKYIKTGRVQHRGSSDDSGTSVKMLALEEGDAVLYRLIADDDSVAATWRKGTVKTCRRDGAYDIVDVESEDVVRKVAKSAVKRVKQSNTKTQKDKVNVESASDSGESEEKILLAADAPVEFRDKRGTWRQAHIHRVRSDGTFDVAVVADDGGDNDGGSDEEIVKRIDRKRIRKPKTKRGKTAAEAASKRKNKSQDERSDTDGDASVRKRRRAASKKGERLVEESNDSESGNDERSAASRRKKQPPLRTDGSRAAFASPLRVNQVVQFPGVSGRMHRGRIKLLRKDDASCDIAHESDPDVVSKRVAMDDVRAVSTFSRLIARPTWMEQRDPRVFQLNARVLYRTPEGTERKAVVVKLWGGATNKDGVGPVYDIEDILDGTLLKKVAGSKLRAVPWLNYSLPQLSGVGFPTTSLFSTLPRKGMRIRFRHRRSGSNGNNSNGGGGGGGGVWQDGVIVRAKSDGTCVVEFTTSSGAREQVRVPNGDIQTRFLSPFSLGNPLRDLLPAIELPRSMYAAGSCVEVARGSEIFLGTVVSSSEADRTYVVEYADGRKEKGVSTERVRLSLRRLRIGTEVEMIVEGPCHEVSRLDGEVAWVHRDERVAVRINGGHNDVFAQVCSHALMVDGKPAFAAPLSSTWLELLGFYLNVTLEALVYAWLCFGLVVEMGEMVQLVRATASDRLQDATFMTALYAAQHVDWSACTRAPSGNSTSAGAAAAYMLIPEQALETERAWLVALLVLKAALTAGCAGFGVRLVRSKILAIQDNYIDVREYQRDQVRRRHLGRVMGAALAVSYLTLVVYAALLSRFASFCLLQGQAASVRFDSLALESNMLAVGAAATDAPMQDVTSVKLTLALAGQTTLNLYRALALHALVFAFPVRAITFALRLVLLLPVVALTALLAALGGAALHVFYYVHSTSTAVTAVTVVTATTTDADSAWAVVLVLATLWLTASIFGVVAAGGRFVAARSERRAVTHDGASDVPDDVLQQAERGEFGLQAKREVLLTKVEQLQTHLGVCKLSVVRVHSLALVHVTVMTLAIYANCRLRDRVASHASAAVHHAVTFHLVSCVLWLMASVLASLAARAIKQEVRVRELWSFLLDV